MTVAQGVLVEENAPSQEDGYLQPRGPLLRRTSRMVVLKYVFPRTVQLQLTVTRCVWGWVLVDLLCLQ